MSETLPTNETNTIQTTPGQNGWRTFGIVIITIGLTVVLGYFIVTRYLFPSEFTPVTLSQNEQQRLDQKIKRLSNNTDSQRNTTRQKSFKPEPYSETNANREIHFSEKELNALVANDKNLASKMAIDLADNLASVKLLIDLDPDFPFIGGKTLKVNAGLELKLNKGQPRAILKGISIWGVPLPNAWLGNLKNTDLFKEYGQSSGFWQAMNEGIETLEIKEGELYIKLKE